MENNKLARIFPPAQWWSLVTKTNLRHDAVAAITTAIIVLPQGVAYAVVAGLPPEYGLYTAIVPAIVAALFGASRHVVCGPTTPLALLVFATVAPLATPGSQDYVAMTLTITLIVGLYQLALALARAGKLASLISHSVIVGFTSGAAVVIMTTQLDNVLGLELAQGASFVGTLDGILRNLGAIDSKSVIVAGATLATAILLNRYLPKWPGLLIALCIGSLVAFAFNRENNEIALLGSLPAAVPPLSIPNFDMDTWRPLLSGALAIALVGLVEVVSIARSVGAQSQQPQQPNQEFFGQGLSNLAGSFFSSYPSTASFVRSNVNVHAGAKTPLAAVFSGLIVLLTLGLIAPLAAYLPFSAIAAVLLFISYRLIDWHHIKIILKTSRQETIVLLITFLTCVFVALDFGIYAGIILSLLLHLNRISHPRIISAVPNPADPRRRFFNHEKGGNLCPQLNVVRVDGSLFFGSLNHIEQALRRFERKQPTQHSLLLLCNSVNFIDIGGTEFLMQEAKKRRAVGGDLYLSGLKKNVYDFLERSEALDSLGRDHVFRTKTEAIKHIYARLDTDQCRNCKVRIFAECNADLSHQGEGLK